MHRVAVVSGLLSIAFAARVAAGGSIVGRVTQADGTAFGGASVLLVDPAIEVEYAGEVRAPGTRASETSATTSDKHGGFVLDVESSELSSQWLVAQAPGWAPVAVEVVDRDVALELVMVPAAGIAGRVVDDQGEPVVGAVLELVSTADPPLPDPVWQRIVPRVSTDAEGGFATGDLGPGPCELMIAADGFLSLRRAIVPPLESGDRRRLELQLQPVVTVRGVVVDLDGAPVVGARVEFESRTALSEPRQASTDADGRFALDGVKADRYLSVSVVHPDFLRHAREHSSGNRDRPLELDIVLERGGSVSGRLLDEGGEPVVGIEYELISTMPPPGSTRLEDRRDGRVLELLGGDVEPPVSEPTTDSEGRFVLTRVPRGTHRLWVLLSEVPTATEPAIEVIDGGRAELDLRVALGRSLAGQVVDGAGQAVPSAWVQAIAHDGVGDRRRPPAMFSDADGRFQLYGIGTVTCDVEVLARGFAQLRVRDVRTDRQDLRLVLEPTGALVLAVRDASGDPVPGIEFRLQPVAEESHRQPTTPRLESESHSGAADGIHRIEPIAPGRWDVQVLTREHPTAWLRDIVIRPGEDAQRELVLSRGAVVVGDVVRAADRSPVANATVEAIDPVTGWSEGALAVATDRDGRFRLTRLAGEQVTLTVEHPSIPSTRVEAVAIRPGAETQVRIEVEAGDAQLQGQVRTGDGDPVGDSRMQLMCDTGADERSTTTDGEGRYRFDAVGAGVCLITSLGGPVVMARPVTLQPGESVHLDLVPVARGELRGRLLDGGVPQAGMGIALMPVEPMIFARWDAPRTTTDPAGGFHLRGVAPGRYQVVVGEERTALRLDLPSPLPEFVDVDIRRAALRGVVVDGATGAPVPRAAVELYPVVGGRPMELNVDPSPVFTDERGRFAFAELSAGRYRLVASRDDLVSEPGIEVVGGDGEEVRIALDSGGRIEGRLQAVDGSPLAGTVWAVVGGVSLQRRTDFGGRFVIRVPRETDVELVAALAGHAPQRSTARAGDQPILTLTPGGSLDLQVGSLWQEDAPVVQLLDPAGRDLLPWLATYDLTAVRSELETSGRLQVVRVPPGTYRLQVRAGDRRAEQQVTIRDGERTEEQVDLEAATP